MRCPTHFFGREPLILSQPVMLVSINHITTADNTKNKFATPSSVVLTPHSDQLQQQLQAQMSQLEQQLYNRESTTHTRGRSIHPSHQRGRSIHPSPEVSLVHPEVNP
jgi:hypothetical protein